MGVQIKIISGFNVGREFEFSAGEREIKIGRASDADVQLHEDDRNCGRGVHARLIADAGHWFVEADHDNGVVLTREGKTLEVAKGARCAIGRNARLSLGKNGPQLRVSVKGSAPQELAPTLKNDQQVSDMPVGELTQELADAAASVRPGFRRLARVIAIIFVIAVSIGLMALVRAEMSRRNTSRLESALRAELTAQRSDADAHLTTLKGTVAALDARTNDGLVAVLRQVEPSVVMLLLSDSAGKVRFIGSGWVAGEKLIATNAHVAEALQEGVKEPELSAIARRAAGDGIQDIRIEGIELHPGYAQWSKILADPTIHLRAGAAGSAKSEALIAPYDAAILHAADKCGVPIPIASDQELRELKAGEEVGYLGYPAENVFDPRSSPPALLTGRIIRLTDFFYNPTTGDPALLIHHNLPTVGGASGSPILNKAGRVIAINSAGSFIGVTAASDQAKPVRVPVGFNYGESVQFVRECLDKSAAQALKDRNSRWQEKLQQFTLPSEELLQAMGAQLVANMQQGGNASKSAHWMNHLTQAHRIGVGRESAAIVRVELPSQSNVLVQACADDRSDIDLEVASDEQFKNILAKDDAANAYPQVSFVTSSGGTCWIRVYADTTILERPSVTVRVSRLED